MKDVDPSWTDGDYFPAVDPLSRPVGNRVLVQMRRVPKKKGLIVLSEDTRKSEESETMIAKVIALGPLAFKKRDTGDAWPEGVWANAGDIVRVPKWHTDKYLVELPRAEGETKAEEVMFGTLNDHEIITVVTGDHRKMRAWL